MAKLGKPAKEVSKAKPDTAGNADAAAELEAAVAGSEGADAGERHPLAQGAKEKKVKYRVLDHGAVITTVKPGDGKKVADEVTDTHFPLKDKKGDDAWTVELTPEVARAHTDRGIRLSQVDSG